MLVTIHITKHTLVVVAGDGGDGVEGAVVAAVVRGRGGDDDEWRGVPKSEVHHTFHVSNLKKCYADEPLAMLLEGVHIDGMLQFVEEPIEIMEWEIK
ncbi:hypothetical protein Tco_0956757 [Tanacetum coccineum]